LIIKRLSQLAIYFIAVLLVLQACTSKWTKSIQYGGVQKQSFHHSIDVEVINGLIIVPVKIKGSMYKFLFDTGAPNSISTEIQNELDFKIVSKGHIVDSDRSRTKVKYVHMDTLKIGGLPFYDQTAFVGDFTENPLFKCLDIDGIVGSNLMRYCNWTIDYQAKKIMITNESIKSDALTKIPFQTDNQYNLLIELKVGHAKVKNITVDYGSNGSLSIPTKVYHSLQSHDEIKKSFNEIGFSQAGLIGNVVELNRQIAFVDTLWLGDEFALISQLTSNGKGLLGSKILSNWIISIDWTNRNLLLHEKQKTPTAGAHGFGIGYSTENGVYIQSVIVDGPAHEVGLRPGMKVLSINNIRFNQEVGFCEIANAFDRSQKTLNISVEDFEGKVLSVSTEKTILQ
jgi:hypothetical protein